MKVEGEVQGRGRGKINGGEGTGKRGRNDVGGGDEEEREGKKG